MKSIAIVNPVRYTGYGYVTMIKRYFTDYTIVAIWPSQQHKDAAVNAAFDLIDVHVINTDYTTLLIDLEQYNCQCYLTGNDEGFLLADQLQCHFFPNNCNDPAKMQYRSSKFEYLNYLYEQNVIKSSQFILSESTLDECAMGRWVVKPSNGAGNIDVHIDPDFETIKTLLHSDTEYMVQDYVTGPEYCMEICTSGGIHRCTMASLYKGEYLVDNVYPWREENEIVSPDDPNVRIMYDYVVTILDTLGVNVGLTWTQVKIDRGVPQLVEINFRSQGRALIGPIHNSTGSNWAAESIKAYLKVGTSAPLMYKKLGEFNKVCVNNYHDRFVDEIDWTMIESLSSVVFCERAESTSAGHKIATRNFTEVLGVIIVQNNDTEQYNKDMAIINSWKQYIGR